MDHLAGDLYSQTLLSITTEKLKQLTKKRDAFEASKQAIESWTQAEPNNLEKVRILSNGLKDTFGATISNGKLVRGSTGNPRVEIDLKNFDRFLVQSKWDPSISAMAVEQWQRALMHHLEVQSLKYSYADLYGRLTTEWLSSKQKVVPKPAEGMDMDDFEQVSGTKRLDARIQWESSVFEAASVTEGDVQSLLGGIFEVSGVDAKYIKEGLARLREDIGTLERQLATTTNFSASSLAYTIKGLSASDLLTEEKRVVLKSFLDDQVVLGEIADVLNMRMASLAEWSWGEIVNLEERRQISGRFNIYMHEDLLQAIFLQYIGIQCSVAMKKAFKAFRGHKNVWKKHRDSPTQEEYLRRQYFLGFIPPSRGIAYSKVSIYSREFFLYNLYDYAEQSSAMNEGEDEADFEDMVPQPVTQQMLMQQQPTTSKMLMQQMPNQMSAQRRMLQSAQMMQTASGGALRSRKAKLCHSSSDENLGYDLDFGNGDGGEVDDAPSGPKNPMERKQKLLHLFSSEILLGTKLHGELTTFRSQFESLMPSLPHVTILTILKFFGVSDKWLGFFRKLLEAPLRFLDDQSAQPRKRLRGTPGAHVLSEVFSEVILFCLDFKINQVTDGNMLWRLGDDMWFWSSKNSDCIKAWSAIKEFATSTGLSLNMTKSGSAHMVRKRDSRDGLLSIDVAPHKLPVGQIRWGMLVLEPTTGFFAIDQRMVDKTAADMAKQLKHKEDSVFSWVQGWNTFATTFFTTNFGKPAICFGRRHIDMMLATHARIQREIFSSSATHGKGKDVTGEHGSVIDFLRQLIEQRFDETNVPDGYFFLPSELGGLDLRSPFINLIQKHESTEEHPGKLIDDFLEREHEAYAEAKHRFETGQVRDVRSQYRPADGDAFFSFEEYTKHREVIDTGLKQVLDRLLSAPVEQSLEPDEDVVRALSALNGSNLKGVLPNWHSMDPYWKWICGLYGPEIVRRFGGFRIVDSGLLPTGMVSLLRNARLNWQE